MPEGVEVKISSELMKPVGENKLVLKVLVGGESRYKNQEPEGLKDFHNSFREDVGGVHLISDVFVKNISVKGKFMYWEFSNGWYLMNTFGMSGQWSPTEGKHVCLEMRLRDSTGLTSVYFNDPRHFGTVRFVDSEAKLKLKLDELGWDPLNTGMKKEWTDYVGSKLTAISKPIGQILMDQELFAGVGNYIRAEALYQAKISPWRPCNKLSKAEVLTLCQCLVDVMNESYKYQGATILTYTDAYGAEGKYSSCFKVYGKKQDPLGNAIIKEDTPDKRSIHWCPTIQI